MGPPSDKAVRVVLDGIRRTKGGKPTKKAPATADRIAAMLAGIPDTLRSKRDRALLTLGFAGRSGGRSWWRSRLPTSLSSPMAFVSRSGTQRPIRKAKAKRSPSPRDAAAGRCGTGVAHRSEDRRWSGVSLDRPPWRRADGAVGGVDREVLRRSRRARSPRVRWPQPACRLPHQRGRGWGRCLRMMEVSRHKRVETCRGMSGAPTCSKDTRGSSFSKEAVTFW